MIATRTRKVAHGQDRIRYVRSPVSAIHAYAQQHTGMGNTFLPFLPLARLFLSGAIFFAGATLFGLVRPFFAGATFFSLAGLFFANFLLRLYYLHN